MYDVQNGRGWQGGRKRKAKRKSEAGKKGEKIKALRIHEAVTFFMELYVFIDTAAFMPNGTQLC